MVQMKSVAVWVVMCVVLLAQGAAAGPREDLVERLPGQPKVGFRQYAGYVTVDERKGRALFYYLAEAQERPEEMPLVLWLNGGPGCSSLGNGAFQELGPFRPTGNGRGLEANPFSWNREANVLFLESPAGVGFSYSNTTSDMTTNDQLTAEDTLRFMLGWFRKFPEYAGRPLYLAGESYAGHYVPQLAVLILAHNNGTRNVVDSHSNSSHVDSNGTGHVIDLRGVAVGNPLLDDSTDTASTFAFWWSHGLIADGTYAALSARCNFSDPSSQPSLACIGSLQDAATSVGDFVDNYDVALDVCYDAAAQQQLRLGRRLRRHVSLGVDVCSNTETEFYLNLPHVQRALHANVTRVPHPWSLCSGPSLNYTDDHRPVSMQSYLQEILRHGVRLWVYSGDLDSVIPLSGTRTNVDRLADSLDLPVTRPYKAWFVDGQVGGWTIEYGHNLTFATVRGAGHMVPLTQPARALVYFRSFLSGTPLLTTEPKLTSTKQHPKLPSMH